MTGEPAGSIGGSHLYLYYAIYMQQVYYATI